MGIFDRTATKKGPDKGSGGEGSDYGDAPVQNVALSNPSAKEARGTAAPRAEREGGAAPDGRSATQADDEGARPSYGIENAIQLMRQLPVDQNVELVVAVIKTTLESLRVRVHDIIDDATRKQGDLAKRVADLRQQISDFEREIDERRKEIARLEADHAETSKVRERLELAEAQQRGAKQAAGG